MRIEGYDDNLQDVIEWALAGLAAAIAMIWLAK